MRQMQLTIFFITILMTHQLAAGQSTEDTLNEADSNSGQNTDTDPCQYIPGPHDAETITATGDGITTAWYGNSTEIYGHGVLGDAVEAHTLYAKIHTMSEDDCALQVTLDEQSVFEDVSPRIADVTGDGINDIITIESHSNKGASLAIYGLHNGQLQKLTSTPYIGQSYRWLAPVGTADFNADGTDDVAFVQTPHLAGILQIWSFKNKGAQKLASKPGFSNHRIGENFITGGIANCNGQPVIIVPDRSWRSTLSATLSDGTIQAKELAKTVDNDIIERHLLCQ